MDLAAGISGLSPGMTAVRYNTAHLALEESTEEELGAGAGDSQAVLWEEHVPGSGDCVEHIPRYSERGCP